MQIKDAGIIAQITQLMDHYQANIASRFMRPLLLQLSIDKWIWDSIDIFVQTVEHLQYQGILLEDLYQHLTAFANFIDITRRQLLPVLRSRSAGLTGPDKILMNMAINTFPSNLNILADLTQSLYHTVHSADEAAARNKPPVYLQYPQVDSIDTLLN